MPQDLLVTPRPLRQQVEDALRDAVICGRFASGEHLSDRMLCDLFGTSRSVVREAVRLLEAEGLLTVQPNRGTFVTRMSPEEATQIYEVRGVLEALAGENFARHASDTECANLRAIFEELVLQSPTPDLEKLLQIKRRFYDTLLSGSRNRHAARVLNQLQNQSMRLRATTMAQPGRLTWTIKELRRIVEAIERRDGATAFEACREHVQRAADVALQVLNNDGKAWE